MPWKPKAPRKKPEFPVFQKMTGKSKHLINLIFPVFPGSPAKNKGRGQHGLNHHRRWATTVMEGRGSRASLSLRNWKYWKYWKSLIFTALAFPVVSNQN